MTHPSWGLDTLNPWGYFTACGALHFENLPLNLLRGSTGGQINRSCAPILSQGEYYWPEGAVSHRSSRVSQFACIARRKCLARGGGFASKLACTTLRVYCGANTIDPVRGFRIIAPRIPVRVYHRAHITDPSGRFRIKARVYHSSRVSRDEFFWPEEAV